MLAATHPGRSIDLGLRASVDRACDRIAPTWPLDRFIAVNPWWGHVDRPIEDAAIKLAMTCGARTLMPRSFYRSAWEEQRIRREHLQAAVRAGAWELSIEELVGALAGEDPKPRSLPLITDVVDQVRAPIQRWRNLVTHQVSQHLAAWFDTGQAAWRPDRSGGVYGSWRLALMHDRGLPPRQNGGRWRGLVESLPATAERLIEQAMDVLAVPDAAREPYFEALLASVRGWAAWAAYERWQARLSDGDDRQIVEILAIRLAWEWLLVEDQLDAELVTAWRSRVAVDATDHARQTLRIDWTWQHALELAYQDELLGKLKAPAARSAAKPLVQAVFCIDVRSERFRRALEASGGDAVVTRGFAGFFGAGVEFTPAGTTAARPQLPGLLAPGLRATQAASSAAIQYRQQALAVKRNWSAFKTNPTSVFSFVETCGALFGVDLLRRTLGCPPRAPRLDQVGLPSGDALRPTLAGALGLEDRIELADKILRAMGLRRNFARLILLVGHGSSSANNPHAAGLDCGACGGQTGEVNARLVADLLNAPEIRVGLHWRGVRIPSTTWFLAGLHDTTTDELELFDAETLPVILDQDLGQLRKWLDEASVATRAERADRLGLRPSGPTSRSLLPEFLRRGTDWSQVRPEWGLANNAAFLVAPRVRSRGLDLDGRVFLHDYDWRSDPGFETLTLIMTAPMVVAHWINLQYYASTVDNGRFGSGNKVLHNVVGANLGVFEGNGGDLRIGLPMQSLHDGEQWRHTPLRLSVIIEAPTDALDDVIAEYSVVRQLVEHQWLHLFAFDADGATSQRLPDGSWRSFDDVLASPMSTSDLI